jgi:hypothetical protein
MVQCLLLGRQDIVSSNVVHPRELGPGTIKIPCGFACPQPGAGAKSTPRPFTIGVRGHN